MKEKDSNSKKRKQGNKLKIQLKKALLNYKRIKIYIFYKSPNYIIIKLYKLNKLINNKFKHI